MAKRYSPYNHRRGHKQASTSLASNIPQESRVLSEYYMKLKLKNPKDNHKGIIKRMTECWLNSQNKYGPREYLEELLNKSQIKTEEDMKWAKYKVLGAPQIIQPRIQVTRKGKWIKFYVDQKLSVCSAVRFNHQQSPTQRDTQLSPIPSQCTSVSDQITHFYQQTFRVNKHLSFDG
ncbi:unnamed protein product [Paramecium pentaurelia]|uniref:Uncharacterized protein n=1 Tax=Paramecium pentaurelia TaxID=43138 RepID=A0A8S1UMA2_9CILI|nr:unnamed protein product [Paramecium pentaurelia]